MAKQPTDSRRRSAIPTLETPKPEVVLEQAPAQIRSRPANENDAGTAMMMQRLRRPPSYDVIWAALIISAIWAAGWVWIYKDVFAVQNATTGPEYLQSIALLILPILGTMVISYFQWRAQQLRQVSEVLMQQAMRLIRPQDIATDGLTSIAQAVRQEVDLLVGGVEHAFQRATALEEIVHKEIAAVERAFGSNEDRIRGLVNGLETQRASLQHTATLVNNDAAPMLSRLESNTQNLGQVINLALSTFTRLEDGLKSSTSELARTIEDVAQRAAETGQEIGSHSTQFERMSTMLVSDFRGFSGQLQDYIQTLNFTANNLGNETRKFGSEVKGMESSLLQVLRQGADQITASHTETAETIERLAANASSNAKQSSAELVQTFGQLGETINYHVKNSTNESASLIERAGIETANRIEQAHGLVTHGLQNVAGDFIQKVNQSRGELTTYVDDASNRLSTEMDQSAIRFNDLFSQSSALLVTNLDRSSNNLLEQLGTSGAGFMGRIEEISGRLSGHLDTHSNRIIGTMQTSAEQYAGALVQHTGTFTAHVDEKSAQLASLLANHSNVITSTMKSSTELFAGALAENSAVFSSRLDEKAGNLAKLLVSHSDTITNTMQNSAEKYAGTLQSTAQVFNTTMEDTFGQTMQGIHEATARVDSSANTISNSLNRASSMVTQEMQSVGANVNDLLVSTSGTIAAHLKETSEIVSRQMQDSGLALAQNIEGSGGLVTDRLISVSGEFVHKINATRDGMLSALLGATGDLTSQLNTTSTSIFSTLEHVTTDLSSQMSGLSQAMNEKIAFTGQDFTSKITASSASMFSGLDKASLHLTDQLDAVSTRIATHIEGTAGQATERMATVTESLTGKLDQSSTQLGSLLAATERRLGNQLEQASTELSALFNENTRMMTEQLEQSSNNVTSTFANTAVHAAQTLNTSSQDVTSKIETASQAMFERLHGTTRELGQRFDVATDHLENVTTEISKRLDGTGKRFAEVLDQASGQIFNDLGKARDAFSEGLGETTLQISGRFEQETGLLVGRIDKAVQEFDTGATTSANKLEDASKKFAKHVETTNTYLADQLAAAAGDIDTRLESVSMQLTGKLEMTSSRISERLDDVSALVDKSVDKFNLEMEHMLTNRRDVLDTLVSDANKRADEVDKVMTGYINMIEESLTTAENRAQHINRIVSDQTAVALGRLEEELRKLETNSSGQVAQAARVLREQHERALSNMNEMLSSTASDFQQTAQDMRITAQQVVKDIDAARGELKRAVIDLPEETRTNADNMRRVVADQISALNALADVVRRQSGTLDYSGPGFMSPRNPPAQTRMIEPAYAPAAPVRSAPAQTAAVARAETVPTVTSNAKLNALAKEVESYTAKLNVSARDVVEAIENALPRDLEKRYVASDKGVYTQRLYESRSRKLIKALEGRYAEERLLRSRVQAYNRLFEKLLDTLSEAPNGDAVMEQVLASEQGRIYVMLAEVAGRLPNQS